MYKGVFCVTLMTAKRRLIEKSSYKLKSSVLAVGSKDGLNLKVFSLVFLECQTISDNIGQQSSCSISRNRIGLNITIHYNI